jgi:hypothetical protein
VVSLAVAGASAAIVPGSVIAKQGDVVGSSTISSVNSPFTDGNGVVSFVAALADNNRIIWKGTGPIFNSADALPDVLSGAEGTMGSGNAGQFIYSPSFNGNDAVYTNAGILLAADDALPPMPGFFSSFNSRPQMGPDGTAYWVGGYTNTQGGSTQGRMLLKATDVSNPGGMQIVLKTGDVIGGFPITASGVGFNYQFSDNGAHHIQALVLTTGSSSTDDFIYLDGALVAREGSPNGSGDNWQSFDNPSVNNAGNYIFGGDSSGPTATDEFLSYNGVIEIREGSTVGGVTLGASCDGAAINDVNQVAFIWDSNLTETLFAGVGGDLANSIALLSVGDQLDLDGDTIGDWTVSDFKSSNVIGPGLDLGEDGYVYVEVGLMPIGGGSEMEAIIRVAIPEPATLGLAALALLGLLRRR